MQEEEEEVQEEVRRSHPVPAGEPAAALIAAIAVAAAAAAFAAAALPAAATTIAVTAAAVATTIGSALQGQRFRILLRGQVFRLCRQLHRRRLLSLYSIAVPVDLWGVLLRSRPLHHKDWRQKRMWSMPPPARHTASFEPAAAALAAATIAVAAAAVAVATVAIAATAIALALAAAAVALAAAAAAAVKWWRGGALGARLGRREDD